MSVTLPFADRTQAGQLLAEAVRVELAPPADALVLGLVRGGAVVAAHLAQAAGLAWDVLIVRKIGAPRQPEYALGAYAESGAYLLNEEVIERMGLAQAWRDKALRQAAQECAALHKELRGGAPPPALTGRHVILTDDGMATGLTMLAALDAARRAGASEVCVAVPVLARDGPALLREARVRFTYLACPPEFHAVGQFYSDFAPVSSSEVRELLAARQELHEP
jgi:putative phosphoribosyl transferase